MTTCLLRRPTVPTLPPGAGEALSDLDLVAGLVLEYRGQPPGTGRRRRLDLARTSEGLQPRHDVRSQRKCRARRSSSDQLKMEFGRPGLCPLAGSVSNSPKPTRIPPGFVAGPAGEARLTNKARARFHGTDPGQKSEWFSLSPSVRRLNGSQNTFRYPLNHRFIGTEPPFQTPGRACVRAAGG